MKTVKTYLLLSYLAGGIFLSGCVSKVQLYPGPKRAKNEVATIKIRSKTHINKLVIDREEIITDDLPHEEAECFILPGEHNVRWIGRYPGTNFDFVGAGTLNAKAGERYAITIRLIYSEPVKESGNWATYKVKSYETTIKKWQINPPAKMGWYETEDFTPRRLKTIFYPQQ